MEPPWPTHHRLQYLLDILMLVGPDSEKGGPIHWAELDSYVRLTGTDLTAWEASLIHRMSCEYVNERREAVNPFSIEPMER